MGDIDEELMETIHKWFVKMRGRVASGDIAEVGIINSFRERERILKIIDISGAISQKKIAEIIHVKPQSMSEVIVKLENDGYISKAKNENDKRETLISLTLKGKERSKEIDEMRKQQALNFLNPLSEDEKETLLFLLKKLIENKI